MTISKEYVLKRKRLFIRDAMSREVVIKVSRSSIRNGSMACANKQVIHVTSVKYHHKGLYHQSSTPQYIVSCCWLVITNYIIHGVEHLRLACKVLTAG